MTDLDERLRAHFDPDRRAELPPGSFDRLEARMRRPAPRAARPYVALAAAVVLVLGIAAIVVTRSDGDQTVHSTDDPSSTVTTAPSTPTTDPVPVTTATTSPLLVDGPSVFAAVVDPDGDGLGDVALLSATTGAVIQTIYTAPHPPSAPEGGSTGAIAVDVSSEGVVYYEVCCEPAAGAVYGYDLDSGEDLGLITYGTAPAVSADGSELAVANTSATPNRVEVVDLGSGDRVESWPLGEAEPGASALVTDIAWSPYDRTVAVERVSYSGGAFSGVRVDLMDVATGATTPADTGDDGVAMPAFRADRTLLVASPAQETTDGGPIAGDRVVIWDPATQQVDGSVEVDRVASLDASSDGTWVIAARYGSAPYRIAGGTGVGDLGEVVGAPDGVIAASW
jgi:hypothetical protein